MPIIGIMVLFSLTFMVCASPFGAFGENIDSQNSLLLEDNNNNIVKASAASKTIDKNAKSTVKSSNKKTVKTVVKTTKMSPYQYKLMVSTIKKHKKAKGVKPNSYFWKSKNLYLTKKTYSDAINRYNKWVKKYKKAPNYVNIFNAVKYKVVSESEAKKATKSLPLAGKLSGKSGLDKLQKYMNKYLNHVNGGPSTFAGVVKSKVGDCWGLAEWAAKQLKSNGYKVRIVQGASSYAWNHRWVQVKVSGKWVNFESSLVTKKYGSKHYSKTCAKANSIVRTL
ncbi:MAG: hypothetical protein LBM26_00315 [Methanobrevibacter sp.]|nr:hypothetical protein [Methanobrevibacter sp.]